MRGTDGSIKLKWPKRPLIRVGDGKGVGMTDRNEFDFEGVAAPSEAADTLNRIAEGIRAHSLALSLGEEQITVHPAGDLSLEIEAREKKGKAKIKIAIAWKLPKADGDDE
jgi:amphi-Trp domain-containing protein